MAYWDNIFYIVTQIATVHFSSLETLNFFGISFLWYDINRITCYNLLFMFKEGKVPKNLKKKATKNKRLADIRDAGGRIYEK